MKVLVGLAVVLACFIGGQPAAWAAVSPTPPPSRSASALVPAGVLTIKARTAGTGTNFSGTYRTTDVTAPLPEEGVKVLLQRRTPTGWDTVTSDTTDENGNLVYGTVRSNFVQTWRLVSDLASGAAGYGVSNAVRIAQHGEALSRVTFPTPGFRAGNAVGINGWFTYRSWWIASGPDAGKQQWVGALHRRLQLQYWTGQAWRTKTTRVTEDRRSEGVNLFAELTTNSTDASRWRWHWSGSSTLAPAVSRTLVLCIPLAAGAPQDDTAGMEDDAPRIAAELWATAREQEQAVRRVPDDGSADRIRAEVRRLAAQDGVSVRTARMDDTVVVVRTDAAVWHESTAVMRQKLTPGPS